MFITEKKAFSEPFSCENGLCAAVKFSTQDTMHLEACELKKYCSLSQFSQN